MILPQLKKVHFQIDCIEQSVQDFLNKISLRGLSPNTGRSYFFDLITVDKWLLASGLELEKITEANLFNFIDWMKTKNFSPATINRRLNTLKVFYKFKFNKEIPTSTLVSRPANHYRGRGYNTIGTVFLKKRQRQIKVKEPYRLPKPLTDKEVVEFFSTLKKHRDKSIVLLMLFSGLRSQEILDLQLSNLNLSEQTLRLIGKGKRERVVLLSPQTIESLQFYLSRERPANSKDPNIFLIQQGSARGYKMTLSGLRSLFRYRRRVFNIEKANPHRFRHTFGTNMAKSGMKIDILQRLMGHANASVTFKYIELTAQDCVEEYQKVLEKLNFKL